MKTRATYRQSLSIMTGMAAAIIAGIGVAGVQLLASDELQAPAAIQMSYANPEAGYTVIYKDPNGPWPGGRRSSGSSVVEVVSGVFIDPAKGFDI